MARFAAAELGRIGVADPRDVLDHVVIRVPRTYPTYFGSYRQLPVVREFTGGIGNLFLVGRNGLHRYNNQDHSMLTAMLAVDAIAAGSTDKAAIWDLNSEERYHEQR